MVKALPGLLAVISCAVLAQPAFEVASIRKSQTTVRERGPRPTIQVSPDGVILRNTSLRGSIRWAYHVFDYQISGLDWLDSERFDISAKAAAPVSEDNLRVMLQTLLAERFKLTLHRQTKELPAHILTVGKNGPKFQESKSDGESNIVPDRNRMSIAVQRVPVSQLIELLSSFLRTPVLDETGLKGRYDITIEAARYLPDKSAGDTSFDPVTSIMRGLQEELGLKLESKKLPLDLLIIDHAERVPTEN